MAKTDCIWNRDLDALPNACIWTQPLVECKGKCDSYEDNITTNVLVKCKCVECEPDT